MFRYLYKYEVIPPLHDFDVGYGFGYYGAGDKLLTTGNVRNVQPLEMMDRGVLAEWVKKNGFKSPAAARKAGESRKALFDGNKDRPGWDALRGWHVLVYVVVIEINGSAVNITR